MSRSKLLSILNVLGLAATIVVSWLSTTGVFNGHTMADLSARYPTPVTPAPYAFSIWGLIYLSLIGFVVYNARAGTRVGGWFLVTCVANCLTDMELTDPLWPEIVFVWWPFCYYTGWITVAILANLAAWLVKLGIGVSTMGAIVLLLLGGAVYLSMTWKRNMREYGFVGVWGLVAIAKADWHRMPAVAGVALTLSVILFVSSSLHAWRNRAYGPFRKRN